MHTLTESLFSVHCRSIVLQLKLLKKEYEYAVALATPYLKIG